MQSSSARRVGEAQELSRSTVDGRNPIRTTLRLWNTYLQGNHHSRVSWVVQDFVHPQYGASFIFHLGNPNGHGQGFPTSGIWSFSQIFPSEQPLGMAWPKKHLDASWCFFWQPLRKNDQTFKNISSFFDGPLQNQGNCQEQ